MDEQYSWKRTEDIEIDLADLMKRFCRQWRQITVCALVSAAVLGGYGWASVQNSLDTDVSEMSQAAELTEEEEQAVTDAVQLEGETRQLETYLENSILMQLDPYHKARHIMLYSIDQAQRRKLQAVTESYLSFVLNGGAADALAEFKRGWKIDKSCLGEVITAYQKTYSSPYQVVTDESADSILLSESLFYVEITGRDADEAEKMALDIQDVLDAYSARVEKEAGSHRLKLVSSMGSITADTGLQLQQHDKKALLSSNRKSLRGMVNSFSGQQIEAYRKAGGMEADGIEAGERQEDGLRTVMKYIFLGLAGSIFAYGCIFSCGYIFRGTLKNIEEMKRMYTFPVFGAISIGTKDGKGKKLLLQRGQDSYGYTEAQVLKRIRLACQRRGIDRLYAASQFPLGNGEKQCLENMAGQLGEWGIDMTVTADAGADADVWDGLTEAGNVLLVCMAGKTKYRMIDDAMAFYSESGISVIGAMVLGQER